VCGICGIAYRDRERPVDEAVLRRMARTLAHRGPDDEGVFLAPGLGLGVRRLAIMDPEGGRQPIANETGDIVVVCNGEIYNHPELRAELETRGHRFRTRSDVETIVHLYEERGEACVERLRGMFAFALWDGPRRRLLLARDRLGIKPLEYAAGDWGVAFGSETKAVLASGHVRARLRPDAVDDTLSIGFSVAPGTAFEGVERVPAGHVVIVEGGVPAARRYWDLPVPGEAATGASSEALARELRERLEESVRIHLRSDVPVGAYLSGGIDSSAVVAIMERNLSRPVAFTISFTDDPHDEIKGAPTLDRYPGHDIEARRVESAHDDLRHVALAIWHVEHCAAISFGLPFLRLAQAASQSFKTVLGGEGSDEQNYGYWFYGLEPWARLFARTPRWARRRGLWRGRRLGGKWAWVAQQFLAPWGPGLERFASIVGPPGSNVRGSLLAPDFAARVTPASERWPAPPPHLARLHPVERLQYWDATTRLPDYILYREDRLAMSQGVEVRVPFLDHELFEWTVRTIPWRKNVFPREKAILRRAMEGLLPDEIRARRKRPLHAPYELWMRGRLPAFAEELLSERALAEKGIFEPRAVRRVLERHRAGREERGLQLLTVLSYQVWDELFVRGRTPAEIAGDGAATAARAAG
jgi:asparagine synthase (glutamine-hydrolysing)